MILNLSNDVSIISNKDLKFSPRDIPKKILKFYFGIGNPRHKSKGFLAGTDYNHRGELPEVRWTRYDGLYRLVGPDVIIRGFKYGLANAVPVNSRAVFRFDRFGQFRDMLEQRQFTHYFSPSDGLQEPAIKAVFMSREGVPVADPSETNCQNLSVYATSSIPYYDGIPEPGLDRSTLPPDTEKADIFETSLTEGVRNALSGDSGR